MTAYPWRFQADLTLGEPDPDVTVFIGDTVTNDTTGKKSIAQDTVDPVIVKLSELVDFITITMAEGYVRETKPPTPV